MWLVKMEKNNDVRRGYLISRIDFGARLLTRMGNIKKALDVYPNLRLAGSGTTLEYVLGDESAKDHSYLIRIDRTCASITIYSKTTPLYFLQEALLRFLSIIQVISKDYELSMSSLYPYLIMVLANQQMRHALPKEPTVQTGNSDILLAKRLIQLMKDNRILSEMYQTELCKSRRLLQTLIVMGVPGGSGIEEIAKSTGLSREEISGILPSLHEIGYKAICVNPDRFELVKL
jgi:hypothetical protein